MQPGAVVAAGVLSGVAASLALAELEEELLEEELLADAELLLLSPLLPLPEADEELALALATPNWAFVLMILLWLLWRRWKGEPANAYPTSQQLY